jgi:hypothetical protein
MTAIESALQTLLQTDATLAAALPGAVHLVTVTATGGTFTLTFAAVTTTAIAEAATAATVQAALVALATVGTGNVAVTGAAGGPFTVTFTGTLAATALALTGSGANLTGPGAALTIAQRAAVYNTLALKPPVSYLTFALVSSTPQFIFGGLASEQYRYQVTVVTQGASRATVNTALTRVDALLAFGDLTVSGETSWGTRKLGDGPSMAQEVGGALWQWGSADYMVELGS